MDDDCAHGYQRGVRIWYAPRVYAETQSLTLGALLEHDVMVLPRGPRTWGDYAALVAVDRPPGVPVPASDAAHLDVVQLSTRKAWRIDPAPGFSVEDASYTFDDTWLYYGETIATAGGSDRVYRLRRIRLDRLDAWAKPL